ncbi:MAG: PHP domain-containing protein [Clostridia bacterium]|nr:PHP domain-containing protein [Clostridia bacterium]
MKIDLHLHSNASDGSDCPEKIVDIALSKGIDVISITDHDTIDGVESAMARGREVGVQVISGIEMSAFSSYEVHVLGYNIRLDDTMLCAKLKELKDRRRERALRIADKLAEYKIYIDKDELLAYDCVGRPHIAKLLIKGGYVGSVQEAFDRYLGKNGIAYIKSDRLTPLSAVKLIKDAGGQAVIAHPLIFLTKGVIEDLISGLKNYGLDGIEAYYPSHSLGDTKKLLAIADKYKLIATGGTDYHGVIRNTEIGSVKWTPDNFTARRLGI